MVEAEANRDDLRAAIGRAEPFAYCHACGEDDIGKLELVTITTMVDGHLTSENCHWQALLCSDCRRKLVVCASGGDF